MTSAARRALLVRDGLAAVAGWETAHCQFSKAEMRSARQRVAAEARRVEARMGGVTIVHFCPRAAWSAAQERGEYRGDTLDTEGFVHCSTPEQVHVPANRLVRGRTDIILLELDPTRISAPIRWEPGVPGDPTSMRFPHVYGPIPLDAVVAVHDLPPQPDGTFTAPTHLGT